jgi:CsoR family transcriptional regulator, copper-sensing transcriptional repressor
MSPCDDALRRNVTDRINRIEGQVRGIKKMIEEERGCYEIVKQVGAVGGALRSLQKVILESHLEACLVEASRTARDRKRIIHDLVDHLSGALH